MRIKLKDSDPIYSGKIYRDNLGILYLLVKKNSFLMISIQVYDNEYITHSILFSIESDPFVIVLCFHSLQALNLVIDDVLMEPSEPE